TEVSATARAAVADTGSVSLVFGCGGERDEGKRAEMGAIAARGADRVIITSDNPRREDPQSIIDRILDGIDGRHRARVSAEVDRRRAIALALRDASNGDIVLIAGKGHETLQDLGDHTIEFDDRVVATELLESYAAPTGDDIS
ncbi:MAG: cyanophycin synthetase, partial [Acidimicrobiia bacterium]|nr:cyanophycin synthetase [Acidimicrobiia bacterium]